jgi:hypothetical protein
VCQSVCAPLSIYIYIENLREEKNKNTKIEGKREEEKQNL